MSTHIHSSDDNPKDRCEAERAIDTEVAALLRAGVLIAIVLPQGGIGYLPAELATREQRARALAVEPVIAAELTPSNAPFVLTDDEHFARQLTHARFAALFHHPATRLLGIEVSTNLYGEWLFVTLLLDADTDTNTHPLTFWGLGYHSSRERWLTGEWHWHQAFSPALAAETPDKAHAWREVGERLAHCQAEAVAAPAPGRRASLYALLADLTDEDGALSELEDLDALGIDIEGWGDDA